MRKPQELEGKVAVAILNYNGRELLSRYLPTVIEHSEEATIYIIDNASTDASLAYLDDVNGLTGGKVQIIALSENYGFCGGYNRGIQQIIEPFVVLLNSDVRVTAGWLPPLLSALEDPDVVACQPKIWSDRVPALFEYAGASGGYMDGYGYPYCRGRVFDHLEADQGQYNDETDVDWGSGACLLVRKDAYLEAGGLYEPLFAHMEEIDLCWRWRSAGRRIRVVPESVVYHLGGATLGVSNPRKTYLNFRNNLIVMTRSMPLRRLLWLIHVRLLLDGVAGLRYLIGGLPLHCWAIVRAHYAYYGWLLFHPKAIGQDKWPGRRIMPLGVTGPLPWFAMILGRRTWASLHKER